MKRIHQASQFASVMLVCGLVSNAAFADGGRHKAPEDLVIALSNDDGYNAPGINAMRDALVARGHTVVLVASSSNQSGSSAVIDFADPRFNPVTVTRESANEYSVSKSSDPNDGAEPATCAMIAVGIVREMNDGKSPDLVLMGINDGANLGSDTQISGTVGGAIHGLSAFASNSIPAIAASTEIPEDWTEEQAKEHFQNVASFIIDFIDHLQVKRPGGHKAGNGLLPAGVGLKIDYPPLSPEEVRGLKLSVQGRVGIISQLGAPFPLTLEYGCVPFAGPGTGCTTIPMGASLPVGGIIGAVPPTAQDVPNSDLQNFQEGYITIVPIEADYTAAHNKWVKFNSVVNTFGK